MSYTTLCGLWPLNESALYAVMPVGWRLEQVYLIKIARCFQLRWPRLIRLLHCLALTKSCHSWCSTVVKPASSIASSLASINAYMPLQYACCFSNADYASNWSIDLISTLQLCSKVSQNKQKESEISQQLNGTKPYFFSKPFICCSHYIRGHKKGNVHERVMMRIQQKILQQVFRERTNCLSVGSSTPDSLKRGRATNHL